MRSLLKVSHPGPCLAITAMATVPAAEAAPRGIGPLLSAPAMLAGQLSVGWPNDACDARRDIAAGRTGKPAAPGKVTVRSLGTAPVVSLLAGLALAAAISLVTLGVNATSTLLGQPAPRLVVCIAAGLAGLGAHFANVLPDLAAGLRAGVRGLPQPVAARWGPAAAAAGTAVFVLGAETLTRAPLPGTAA